MNVIGKFLVLVNVLLSLAALTWALAIYLDPTDWGKKTPKSAFIDPPKDKKDDKGLPNELQPSEWDKRKASLSEAATLREPAEVALERAQRNRDQLRLIFADNHMKYVKLLDDLEHAPGPVAVMPLKFDAHGRPALDRPGLPVLKANNQQDVDKDGKPLINESKRIGYPMFDAPLKEVNKSYQAYLADLKKVTADYFTASKKLEGWIDKEEKLTVRVTGVRDEKGKFTTPGYYDLLELEGILQRRLKSEIEYVQPLWVRELVSAQYLLERRRGLIKRLQELGDKSVAAAPQ
jgi:hypothetical protein